MTYAMAKRLAKRPETASLAPHVEDMRRARAFVAKLRWKRAANLRGNRLAEPRTPLTSILGGAKMLSLQTKLPLRARDGFR